MTVISFKFRVQFVQFVFHPSKFSKKTYQDGPDLELEVCFFFKSGGLYCNRFVP